MWDSCYTLGELNSMAMAFDLLKNSLWLNEAAGLYPAC